jgi:hypothetical protein
LQFSLARNNPGPEQCRNGRVLIVFVNALRLATVRKSLPVRWLEFRVNVVPGQTEHGTLPTIFVTRNENNLPG